MKRTLTFVISSHPTHCYSSPGKPCPFVMQGMRGWSCLIFSKHHGGKKGQEFLSEDKPGGYLMRHPECLRIEKLGHRCPKCGPNGDVRCTHCGTPLED